MNCSPETLTSGRFKEHYSCGFYSCGLLKPDALERGLEEEVFDIIQEHDFEIIAVRETVLSEEQVRALWPPEELSSFWEELKEAYMAGPSIFFIVRGGPNAIQTLTDLVGNCEPTKAEPHTIRHRFGETIRRNAIHSTSSEETFWREVCSFFTPKELVGLLD
jgi:nucleoside-diphosphate kinase